MRQWINLIENADHSFSMKLYHGTTANFDAFDLDKIDSGGAYGRGFYFSNSKGLARQYSDGGEPITAVVTLNNPWRVNLDLDYLDPAYNEQKKVFRRIGSRDRLIEAGYDGVVVTQRGYVEAIAYYPEQIKIEKNNITESADVWPETISGTDLAEYVETWHHSPEDFDEGDIIHNVEAYGLYHLRRLPLSLFNLSLFTIHDGLVNDYSMMPPESAPPIIVSGQHNIIIDGNHRANAAAKRGETDILAYVGDESTYDPAGGDEEEWQPDRY